MKELRTKCPGTRLKNSGPEGMEIYEKIPHLLNIGEENITLVIDDSLQIVKVVCAKLNPKDNTCTKSGQTSVPCLKLISEEYIQN